jgi:hypothetical protein
VAAGGSCWSSAGQDDAAAAARRAGSWSGSWGRLEHRVGGKGPRVRCRNPRHPPNAICWLTNPDEAPAYYKPPRQGSPEHAIYLRSCEQKGVQPKAAEAPRAQQAQPAQERTHSSEAQQAQPPRAQPAQQQGEGQVEDPWAFPAVGCVGWLDPAAAAAAGQRHPGEWIYGQLAAAEAGGVVGAVTRQGRAGSGSTSCRREWQVWSRSEDRRPVALGQGHRHHLRACPQAAGEALWGGQWHDQGSGTGHVGLQERLGHAAGAGSGWGMASAPVGARCSNGAATRHGPAAAAGP